VLSGPSVFRFRRLPALCGRGAENSNKSDGPGAAWGKLHCGASLEVKCRGRFLSRWILILPKGILSKLRVAVIRNLRHG